MKKIAVALTLAAGSLLASAAAIPAHASVLTCYRVGFQRLPSASLKTNPPGANVDDGDPYISQNPGGC
jgi:hypothetical protein